MPDPAYALQDALVDALRGATEVGNNVFDHVPTADPFPRITVGPHQTIRDSLGCYEGQEAFVQIDVWSRLTGFPQAKRIASEVIDVLDNAELTLDGFNLHELRFEDAVYSRDPDGKTSRARISLRALTQPETST